MSPILVRPVREQLEHDRVIRLLQADLAKKKVEVGINPGAEQNASVGGAGRKEFPDAVLYSTDKGRKLIGVVEVETAESVNHLEAMSQWAHLAKLKVPFHLYVPTASVDVARRLSEDHAISVSEIWSYHQVGEQFRFTLIYPPPSRRSAAAVPRTVSVASIRVEPRVDPTATDGGEPEPAGASGPVGAGPKVVPARPRVVSAKPARAPEPAKSVAAKALPVSRPAKSAPPVKVVPAKAGPANAAAPKAAPPKAAVARAEPAKAAPAKAAPAKAAPAKVAAKIAAPADKTGNGKHVSRIASAAKPAKAEPRNGRGAAASPSRQPARNARPTSAASRGSAQPRQTATAPVRGKSAARPKGPGRNGKAKPAPTRKPASRRK